MGDKFRVKAEWYFEHEDGSRQGPFFNSFSPEGLTAIAGSIQAFPSPYLVVGDDTAGGYVITEVFRKPVSIVTQNDNVVRFRTQLLTNEGNGNHNKTSIFIGAADSPGTGVMLNLLNQLWSKTSHMILTVECRITVQGVV